MSDGDQRQQTAAAISDRIRDSCRRRQPAAATATASEHADLVRSPGRAGFDNVPHGPSGTANHRARCHTGLPRAARCGLFSRRRGRPPACHRRGRSPLIHYTIDRADGATLGRRRRTRRPGIRKSGSGAVTFIKPVRPAISRTRPSFFADSDGQARRPPPQSCPRVAEGGPEGRSRENPWPSRHARLSIRMEAR